MSDSEAIESEEDIAMDISPEASPESEKWQAALAAVIPAVVVLKVTATRAFDTQHAGSSSATGFIVDKERGIILTNRHVVKPGPVVAEAIFVNREEIPVFPVYRDPVHDFGFFRYDPKAIKYLSYEEIPLAPQAACVGLEIRVVGNDSGEKVSISAGTLARLDRQAPRYKKDGYNDFNTFYIQAASGTKGGSSGSPVIDCQGRAVAVNAGGKSKRNSSASAFFLPLKRAVRALELMKMSWVNFGSIPNNATIPRGTLQVTFLHKGFDEISRLGLQRKTEQMVRHVSFDCETGMLVVDSVVPGGPAHKYLEPGDVLIHVNVEVVTQFLVLEALLDDNIGKEIDLHIERGGTSLTVKLMVQDLHSITPNQFLEISGAVIHSLSYQQARNFHRACGLVYVSETGYMLNRAGVPRHAIIKKFSGHKISKLDDLISAVSKLSKGARVPLEYVTHTDSHRKKQSVLVTIDRHEWHAPPQIYTRNDITGFWISKPAIPSDSPLFSSNLYVDAINQRLSALTLRHDPSLVQHKHEYDNAIIGDRCSTLQSGGEYLDVREQVEKVSCIDQCTLSNEASYAHKEHFHQHSKGSDPCMLDNQMVVTTNASLAEHMIEPALVMFEVHVPPSCMLDGVRSRYFSGTGVIIYHSETMGLVAVDRNIVALSVSDVMLSFAAFPIEIPGEVVFLHPVHNYALVAYKPSSLGAGASMVRAAELLPEPGLRRGDSIYLVGLGQDLQATSRKSTVTNPCTALNLHATSTPRYRATNVEVIAIADFGCAFSGVLTDERGRVQALWAKFSTELKNAGSSSRVHQFFNGIPIYVISNVLDKIISSAHGLPLFVKGIKKTMPLTRILEVELCPRLLSKARSFGLSDNWIQGLLKKDPVRRQVLRVKGCLAGSKASSLLKSGDMILAVNNEPITCFRDIENACQAIDKCNDNGGELKLTVFRQGREIELVVGTNVRDGNGTTQMVNWCGCVLQYPHYSVRALGFLPKEGHGVYVASWCHGSPANRYGLHSLQWIVEINGKLTPDLETFLEVVKELEHGEFVRVKTVKLSGKPCVLTLKQDLHYWPTWELKYDPESAKWRRRVIKALDSSIA